MSEDTIRARMLVVEDEPIARENLELVLAQQGYEVTTAEHAEAALAAMTKAEFDVVLTDLSMPGMGGMALLEHIRATWPDTEVLVLTGYSSVESAVHAMRQGAYYYLAKPYKIDELRLLVARALEKRQLRREVEVLRRRIEDSNAPQIIGRSPAITALKEAIAQVAPVDSNVLILGETGTGKELVARYIHALSRRRDKRFLAINCASFNEDLLTNELFGHESGAYTGARQAKKGLIEAADQGTFFLDEIGDMSLAMQAKLLRVLEEKTLLRLGGNVEVPVDVRFLAATNRDLKAEVEQGNFRQDLFYRLNVITLRVPPLAARRDDIHLLCNYFLHKYAVTLGKGVSSISPEAMRLITSYAFPGNVRELENIVERAVVMCNGTEIQPGHLPPDLTELGPHLVRPEENDLVSLKENERRHIARVLRETSKNRSRAAEILGIDRASLWRKMKRFGLE